MNFFKILCFVIVFILIPFSSYGQEKNEHYGQEKNEHYGQEKNEHYGQEKNEQKKYSKLPFKTKILLFTNHSKISIGAKKGATKFKFQMKMEEYESDTFKVKSLFSRKFKILPFSFFGGGVYEGKKLKGLLGISYLLPLSVKLETLIKTDKEIEIKLKKQISMRFRLNLGTEYKFKTVLGHEIKKHELKTLFDYQLRNHIRIGIYHKMKYKLDSDVWHSLGVGLGVLF